MRSKSPPPDVNEYIKSFPLETQRLLKQLRGLIKNAAPEAEESISYHMPAYKYKGVLVYFGGYDRHIGFYPTPSAVNAFKNELKNYKCAKGSIQFPIDEPLPSQLITDIVSFRVEENLQKLKKKK
jgi:uncharacterized protein YdhG (YjbR/CyaY superfamily)